MVALNSAFFEFFPQDWLNLNLEKIYEVDGEDGPHAIVGEPFTGLHTNDEKNPPEIIDNSCKSNP